MKACILEKIIWQGCRWHDQKIRLNTQVCVRAKHVLNFHLLYVFCASGVSVFFCAKRKQSINMKVEIHYKPEQRPMTSSIVESSK